MLLILDASNRTVIGLEGRTGWYLHRVITRASVIFLRALQFIFKKKSEMATLHFLFSLYSLFYPSYSLHLSCCPSFFPSFLPSCLHHTHQRVMKQWAILCLCAHTFCLVFTYRYCSMHTYILIDAGAHPMHGLVETHYWVCTHAPIQYIAEQTLTFQRAVCEKLKRRSGSRAAKMN